MYQAMKRHSLLCVCPRLIAALVLGIFLLSLTVGSVIDLLSGPLPLDADAQPGTFASIDMSRLVSTYATQGTGNSVKSHYILYLGEGAYLSLRADGSSSEQLTRALNQAYDYYRNDSGILNPMGTVSGKVIALSDELNEALLKWASGSELEGFREGETNGHIVPIELWIGHVGLFSFTWVWILFALGILALIWLAIELYIVLSGRYYRQIQQSSASSAAQEWQDAEAFGNARIGDRHIWYTHGPYTRVFSLQKVVWVYKQFDSKIAGSYKWPVSIFTSDQTYHELCVREDAQRDRLIDILHDHGGCFVTGYTQDNYEQFCNDFPAFCARAAANDPTVGSPLIKLPE